MSRAYIKEWHPQRVRGMVSGKLVQNMDRAAAFAEKQAWARASEKSGLMKGDIAHEVEVRGNTIEGRIGVKRGKAFYAIFIEKGTSKMRARPFLRPAVFGNAAEIVRLIRGG